MTEFKLSRPSETARQFHVEGADGMRVAIVYYRDYAAWQFFTNSHGTREELGELAAFPSARAAYRAARVAVRFLKLEGVHFG